MGSIIIRVAALALSLLVLLGGATAWESEAREQRIALVIGNSSYRAVAGLPHARTDAEAIAASLKRLGFQYVDLQIDLSREAMVREFRTFAEQADLADWAVIYYAGHGIEIDGTNYMVPVDARLAEDRDAEDELVPLDRGMRTIGSARKLSLMIVDACRDNPFLATMKRKAVERSVSARGFARVERCRRNLCWN